MSLLKRTFGTRVRALMALRADLDTQMKLAARSGVGQSTIARILASDTAATLDSLEAIAGAFGLPPAALLTDDEDLQQLLASWGRLTPDDRRRLAAYASVGAGR